MDNIFEILILGLFILFNVFASWFQKKKKEQERDSQEVEQIESEEKFEEPVKSIEEILFGTSKKNEVPAPDYSEFEQTKTAYSDEKMKRAEDILKRQKAKVEQIKEAKKTFRKKNNSLKVKLHNPENLKDYILITEILNKPKYFDY
ncbi:MAG: hypothetical protein JEY94_12015 [Melioribacteraceae bacterium]|nr:hypothetical protein [Melioribacteraceae bacterium]